MSIDLLDVNEMDGLSEKQKVELLRVEAIVSRIKEANLDITEAFTGQWTKIALSLATLGEPARKHLHAISSISSEYNEDFVNEKFTWCIANTKLKGLHSFDKICKKYNVDVSSPLTEDLNPVIFLPAGVDEDAIEDVTEYGFFEMGNRLYKMEKTEKGYKHVPYTNFKLRVKYHIYDKIAPKRIIEMTNCYGKRITVDAPTDIFTSINNFTKFIEGHGNFLFEGTGVDLRRLKRKLFEKEKECFLIDILGWNKRGFWAWSNGIFFKDQFITCDDDGIVDLKDYMFYIPAGNKVYAGNDEELSGQKKFRHIESEASFHEYCEKVFKVYGNHAMVALCFGFSCLFSDVVCVAMNGGFPLLFLYGEGSSGKGKLMSFLQSLCGIPQTALKISEKANTDKAKIREMAQFRNGISGLEEYTNAIDDKALNTLKGIWDRLGYKRAIMDSKYGNESVPINSGVIVTGNEYPADDPLLQRLIVLEMNKNTFTQEEKDIFNQLSAYVEKGITTITNQLIRMRPDFERDYRNIFQHEYKSVSKELSLFNLTDRMVSNVTALVATYELISKQFTFPFTKPQLIMHIKDIMERQSMKREIGAPIAQWWDCMLQLANSRQIKHGREFHINGDYVTVNYALCYPLYAREMHLQRNIPQKKGSLMDKLKLSKAFVEATNSYRYGNNLRTSGYTFKYHEIGVDLLSVAIMLEDEERQKQENYKARNSFPGNQDTKNQGSESNNNGESEQVSMAFENSEDRPF